MNTLLQAICYMFLGSCVISGAFLMLVSLESSITPAGLETETNWPIMLTGFALAIVGTAGFIAMREAI